MASAKNNNKQPTTAEVVDFDYSSFLPDGATTADLRTSGGLTPMYAWEEASENNWPPVAGWLDRIEKLPEIRKGKKDAFTPFMLRVVATRPTKAISGTKDQKEEVDITPNSLNEDILVPINGQLSVNTELLMKAQDEKLVHYVIMRLRGSRKVNDQPSEMWDIHVQFVEGKAGSKAREGRFAAAFGVRVQPMRLSDGQQVYDGKTGEIKANAKLLEEGDRIVGTNVPASTPAAAPAT